MNLTPLAIPHINAIVPFIKLQFSDRSQACPPSWDGSSQAVLVAGDVAWMGVFASYPSRALCRNPWGPLPSEAARLF